LLNLNVNPFPQHRKPIFTISQNALPHAGPPTSGPSHPYKQGFISHPQSPVLVTGEGTWLFVVLPVCEVMGEVKATLSQEKYFCCYLDTPGKQNAMADLFFRDIL